MFQKSLLENDSKEGKFEKIGLLDLVRNKNLPLVLANLL
jgi:hypothetical protein